MGRTPFSYCKLGQSNFCKSESIWQKKDYNAALTTQHLCPYARRAVEGFPVLPALWSWEKWSAAAEGTFWVLE